MGTSGSAPTRFGKLTARAYRRLDLTCGTEAAAAATIICVCPETVSMTAGPVPL